MKTISHKLIQTIFALAILISSQIACQTVSNPTATPQSLPATETTSPSSPTDAVNLTDDEIKAGIQTSLDIYAQAYNENNPELLEQVVDQENKPFHRIARSRFDNFQLSSQAGTGTFSYTLINITKREFGYVIAQFKTGGGYQADWPFRLVNGVWVITEPTVEQVGEPVITDTEHFTFTTYPWADDVNQQIMDMMETARTNVEKVLGEAPTQKANVKIMPIYGLSPFNPMNAIALYNKNGGAAEDTIEVYTPESFAYSYYDPAIGWEGELQRTLTHEYTHMTHARVFNNAGRLSDWMSEGLAEYVSGADQNLYWACDSARSGTIIPILDESDATYKQDLMHMYLLDQDFGLSYSFAHSLVSFTVENYGGLDGFWKLANALDTTSDFKKAVQSAFGISYEEYDQKWREWLEGQC
ncbi:MAG: hypothetical protein H7Y59_07885 [Anaerolineales bacterium]|nr:hypothetical protein [Anaerolineales bacterium]